MQEATLGAAPLGVARRGALYDAALALASREGRWRSALVRQVAARAGDVIVEFNCGSGALAAAIAESAPRALVVAIDENEAALERARARARDAGVRIEFAQGTARDATNILANWAPNKIVSSFIGRAFAQPMRRRVIEAAAAALRGDGRIHLADYGAQRTALMQQLFRAAQQNDIVDKSFSAAPDAMIAALRASRFVAAEETESFPTLTGSVSLFSARIS
ncbi:MAG: methyltransferase domain-containing protein [Hyphomonadaceae bacterium]